MRSFSGSRWVFAGLMLSFFAASCGKDEKSDDDCDRGEEGCRCKSDDTCDPGLVCDVIEDECTDPGGAGGGSGKGGSSGKAGGSGKGGSSSGNTSAGGRGGTSAGSSPFPAGNAGVGATGSAGEGGGIGVPSGGAGGGGEGGEAGDGGQGNTSGNGGEAGSGGPGAGNGGSAGSSGGTSGSAGSSSGTSAGGTGGKGGTGGTGGTSGSAGSSSGTSAGGTGGKGGTGGTGGTGGSSTPTGGSSGSSSGTSAGGSGGSSGQSCPAITLGSLAFDLEYAPEVAYTYFDVNPQLGTGVEDLLELSFYDFNAFDGARTGAFTLGTGADANYESCSRCVLLRQDDDAKFYFATAGTLTLASDSHQMWGYPKGSLSNVTLREVVIVAGESQLVIGGACLTLATAAFNVPPPAAGWYDCPDAYYSDGDCDCGCGAVNTDCSGDDSAAACEFCWCPGDEGDCELSPVEEDDNGQCGG